MKIINFKILILPVLLCLSFFVQSQANAQGAKKPKKRVAVLSFTADNTDQGTARIVRNSIELSLFETKRFDILEQDQVDDILKERKLILTECSDEMCAAEIGGILSSEYVIIGSVSKLEKYNIQVKVINVETKKIIIADSTEADDINEIRDVSADLAGDVAERIQDYGKMGWTYSISASFQYIIPLGYLSDRAGPGYGVCFSGRIEDIFFSRFISGIDAGYIYFNEKSGVTHHSVFIPLMIAAAYRIQLPWRFSIVPEISGGGSYNSVYYYTEYNSPDYARDSAFQPMAKAGASVEYMLPWDFYLRLGASYGAVFEKDGDLEFLLYHFSGAVSF